MGIRRSTASLLIFALAALANLSFLVPFLATAVWFVLTGLATSFMTTVEDGQAEVGGPVRRLVSTVIFPLVPAGALLAAIYARTVPKLVSAGEFHFGGTEGFWADTVGSVIRSTLYGKAYLGLDLVLLGKVLVAALVLVAAGSLLWGLARGRGLGRPLCGFLLYALALPVLS